MHIDLRNAKIHNTLQSYIPTPSQETTQQEWLVKLIPDTVKNTFAGDYSDAMISLLK